MEMKNFKRYHLAYFMFLLATSLRGQNIQFTFNSGNTESFPLNEVRKITFSENNLNLHLYAGSIETWDLSTIRHYAFDYTVGLPKSDFPEGMSGFKVFPNPASAAVKIEYTLQRAGNVSLEIYDLQGKQVKRILNMYQAAGKQEQYWNTKDDHGNLVPAGHYVCRIMVDGNALSKTIILQ
jgi:hypothetical protein